MTSSKIQTVLGLSVITITKYLMEHFSVNHEEAYKKLISTDFYELLNDIDTDLYLETNEYLCKGCVLELEKGREAMYKFINQE